MDTSKYGLSIFFSGIHRTGQGFIPEGALNPNADVDMTLTIPDQLVRHFIGAKGSRINQMKAGRALTHANGAKEQQTLVPTIDVRKAQATKEADRVRILQAIEDDYVSGAGEQERGAGQGGMETFNARLQAFMEAALQEEARAALLARQGA